MADPSPADLHAAAKAYAEARAVYAATEAAERRRRLLDRIATGFWAGVLVGVAALFWRDFHLPLAPALHHAGNVAILIGGQR